MIIAKTDDTPSPKRAGYGKSGKTVRIRQNVLSPGSPDFYLEPLNLESTGITNLIGKPMMQGMLDFLFSSFTERTERWWNIFLDTKDVKSAFESHQDWDGEHFSTLVYNNHLKHNFKILQETSIMDLINLYNKTSAVTDLSAFLSKDRNDIKNGLLQNMTDAQKKLKDKGEFPTEEDIDMEIMKIVAVRKLLSDIKLEEIDKPGFIERGLGLPTPSGETTQREEDLLYTRKDKEVQDNLVEVGDVKRPAGEMIPAGKKLMDSMLYNIGLWDKKQVGQEWEAGPNYSDLDEIDIVNQYMTSTKSSASSSPNVTSKKRSEGNARINYNKKTGEATFFIRVEIDTGEYFEELMERNKIMFSSEQQQAGWKHSLYDKEDVKQYGLKGKWTKANTFVFDKTSKLLPPSLFLQGQSKEDWAKKFLDEDGNIDDAYINGDTPIPGINKIDLTALLRTNNDLARIIKKEIQPNFHSIISFAVVCNIGYPIPEQNQKLGHFERQTTFEVQEVRIQRYRQIKVATYGFKSQSQFGRQEKTGKFDPKKPSKSVVGRGGKTAATKTYYEGGDPKIASILIPMKRRYKTMKEMIP